MSAAGALVINVVLARLLAPADLGRYFTLWGLVYATAILARLGLDRGAPRLITSELAMGRAASSRRIALRATAVAAVGGAGSAVLLLAAEDVVIALFRDPDLRPVIAVAAGWLTFEALRLVVSELHRGYGDIRWATATGDAARSAATVAAFSLAWLLGFEVTLVSAVWLSVFAGAAATLLALLSITPRLTAAPSGEAVAHLPLLAVSLPLMVFGLFANVLYQGDILVMSAVGDAGEVALYGTAVRLATALAVPFVVAQAVLAPVVGRLIALGRLSDLEDRARGAATVALLPTLVGFMFLPVLGDTLLAAAFGAYYRQAGTLLIILALGQVANTATGLCQIILIYGGRERAVMSATAAAALVLVVGATAAGRTTGPIGVATFSTVAVVVEGVVMVWMVRRYFGVWTTVPLSRAQLLRSVLSLRHGH
jgi:O-antigen/teichoic acid export membrane protein